MEKNKIKTIFGILLIVILFCNVVSALDVCCEKTKDGAWCQNVPEEECEEGVGQAPGRCEDTGDLYCKAGTCINTRTGTCEINSPKAGCEFEGNSWDEKDKDEIPMCQEGCCISSLGASFITQTECKKQATDYSIENQFDSSIRNENTCISISLSKEEGACVTKKDYEIDCDNYITQEECAGKEDSTFYPNLLCTAIINAEPISNCAPTEETTCYKEGKSYKVYFLDSCKNRANVYDENMFSKSANWNQDMKNYWQEIQDPVCIPNGASSICGDCNYRAGSSCVEYKSGEKNMPSEKPEYGDYVCSSMDCYYDTNHDGTKERYQHGESWCAETEGTYFHLPLYLTYDKINSDLSENEIDNIDDVREELKDSSKYNLPGSRYYRLVCWEGEIKTDPCDDYRQEICVEKEIVPDYSYAQCILNGWRDCMDIGTKIDCEDTKNMCKWVWGYRYDLENENPKPHKGDYDFEEQGSCVPLISPGIDFWNSEATGQGYCVLGGSVIEYAQYETHWTGENFIGDIVGADGRDDLEDSEKLRANRCYDNCYAIPGYGKEYDLENGKVDEIFTDFHKGWKNELGVDKIEDNLHISDRRGYYCKGATGEIWGDEFNCKPLAVFDRKDKHEKKLNKIPIFYTNEQWLMQIQERASALGDCGYKENLIGEKGNFLSEIITAKFQKLNQKGKVTDESEEIMLWAGDTWVKRNYEDFMKKFHSIVREGEQPDISEFVVEDEDGDTFWNFNWNPGGAIL